MKPRVSLPAACALFLASGASGLVYEVVWMRQLTLVLSVTVYAVTTVLCAFMAGLALGAAIGGPLADRLRSPLRAYGIVELAMAVTGVTIPWILFNLGPLWIRLHDAVGGAGMAYASARFLVAFGVLLVPCTLMGMTLPLLSRAVIGRMDGATRGAGLLYAINTLGAVLGTFLAGFVLLRAVGLYATSALAALVNLAVGLVAMRLGRDVEAPVDPAAATAAPPRPYVGVACVTLAVSGFTALGYEVLWTRALEQFVHNSAYAYSAMLVTFLFGLAAGSAAAAALAERARGPLVALGLVEIAVGASVVGALMVYGRFGDVIPAAVVAMGGLGSWYRVVLLIFAEAGATMLVTTCLLGMAFPFALRLVVTRVESLGTRLGVVYAANTVGSIAGAWLVGFVLLPRLGVRGAFLLLVGMNFALGAWLLGLAAPSRARRVGVGAAAAAALAGALWLVPPDLVRASFERQFGRLLFYREDVTDTVMVTDHDGERMIRYGDGRGTAGTMTVREDRMYAHIPMLLHPSPRRVLNICFGVGNSLAGVVTHPVVEHVDSVELSPSVVAAAPFFERTNHRVLDEPRVRLVVADGRNFLLTTHEIYDVIRLDPPELHTAGVVNLYTREFYRLAQAHLAPGGIFSIWVNIVMTPEVDLRHVVRTVRSVFPHVSVWHGPLRYSWVINGSMTPHAPDLQRLMRYYAIPSVHADLEAIGVPDPYAFLDHFVFETTGADRFAGPGPLVTDNHTMLDFTVPMSIDSAYGIANANTQSWLVDFMKPGSHGNVALELFFAKIKRMMAYKEPVAPFVVNVEGAGLDRAALEARLAAPAAG